MLRHFESKKHLFVTMNPTIISIEGNIGSGKSTVLAALQKHMKSSVFAGRIVFLPEPVDAWANIRDPTTGETMLEKFYADSAKYAFPFQVMAYATRLAAIRQAVRQYGPDCIIICERSLEADKHIFAKMLYDDGKIEDINHQVYMQFYKEYAEDFPLSGVVYMNTTAEVCARRVATRAREGESAISVDYLSKCKSYHDTWLGQYGPNQAPVCEIDANFDVDYDIPGRGQTWLKAMEQFICDIAQTEEQICKLERIYLEELA
jgi:deoxyadenosine/deoxycytidine kinase